jgi:PAS domain S-box-containing protein
MEKVLRDNKKQYKLLAEHSADILYKFNLESEKYIYVSPSVKRVLGYDQEEALSLKVQDTLTEESYAIQRESLRSALESGLLAPSILEIEAVHKDGRMIPLEIHANFMFDKHGVPVEVLGVARDISDRKRMEKALKRRADFDRLVSQISSAFVGLTGIDIDEEIHYALNSIGAFIGADRAYVFQFQDNSEHADNTHEWCADGVESQINRLKNVPVREKLPWFDERIRRGETFSVSSVAALPPEARHEREHFEAQGTQSFIAVPMISGGRLLGFFGFDAVWNSRVWDDDDLSILHFVGEVFVNALERKHWEKILNESWERLDLAIKGTNAGLWDWYVQTGQTLFDERWAEIIGYTVNELEPMSIQTWIDHCHPDDLAKSNMELEKHFAGKTNSYSCEVRMRHKKGNWVWIIDRGKVVNWDENGKPVRMVGTHVDITARKIYEAVTQAERDMAAFWSLAGTFRERLEVCLKTAIQVSSMDSGGLYLANENDGSLMLEVHQGLSEIFINKAKHYPSDSVNAMLVQKGEPVFSPYRDLSPDKNDLASLEGLKAVSIIPVHFQGRAIACLNLASHSIGYFDEQSRAASKKIASYLGSFIVQEMLEEKNRKAWRDLDALFNTIQDMLFILDSKGVILAHNRTAANRLGYDENELVGRHVFSVHPQDRQEEVSTVIARMIAKEMEFCHIPLITKNGELISVETRVILGHWKNQEAIYGISRDISGRLQLEQQTRQIVKAESLSRMAGSIAHNFNNILSVVIGNLELAMLDLHQQDRISNNLSEAFQASKRAADMTQLMLTYLGQSNVKHELLDLSSTCRQMLPILEKEMKESVAMEIDFPSHGPIIIGNANQMYQLFQNLALNAVESLDDRDGTIHISIKTLVPSAIPTKRLPVDFSPQNTPYVCLEVKDSGCGILEKDIEKIFDPFFSTKFTGRGLGLAVALGIVREHEGAIALESNPGKGSVFRAFLPLPDEQALFQ